jgi:hypothetical protein
VKVQFLDMVDKFDLQGFMGRAAVEGITFGNGLVEKGHGMVF